MTKIHGCAVPLPLLFSVLLLAGGSDSQADVPARTQFVESNQASSASPRQIPIQRQAHLKSELIALDLAKSACSARDFRSFFDAFVSSKAVRQKYSMPEISLDTLGPNGEMVSRRVLGRSSYADFPVIMQDYYYKPAKSAKAGDTDEYLDLEFNQSQHDDHSVEWSRIHYDGQTQGGDDLGNALDASGRPLARGIHQVAEGQLLFRPTAACWVFSEDIRFKAGK